MRTTNRAGSGGGFTLIELLVVIAIIGVLAGMLYPVLAGAQEHGRRVDCANKLSQFGKGLALYAMDHDDRFPTNLVTLAAKGYTPDPQLYVCRSDRWRTAAVTIDAIHANTADAHCSYDFVTRDARGGATGPGCAAPMMIACDKNGATGDITADAFGGNHADRGGNALYLDSSVRWIKTESWTSNSWGRANIESVVGY